MIRGRVGLILTALLALASSAVPASAQEPLPGTPGAPSVNGPTVLAEFGFGGLFPAERWGPITVAITTGDEPLAGSMLVEFDQDNSQRARTTVPFAATPNRTTLVPIVAAIPAFCGRVSFTLLSERGNLIKQLTYTRPGTENTPELPPLVDTEHALLVSVGRTSLPESVRDWSRLYSGLAGAPGAPARRHNGRATDRDEAWSFATAAHTEPDALPLVWTAYDGVCVLVVNPQASGPSARTADPRAIAAVTDWVRSGGRLVLLADGPGDAWRQWLPDDSRAGIDLGDVQNGPVPPDLHDAIDKAARDTRDRVADDPDNADLKADVPPPAAAAPRRLIRITEPVVASGWRIRWSESAAESEPPRQGLLAEGPVGFGLVTILGIDPARVPAELSTRATAGVWRSALATAMRDHIDDAAALARARTRSGWSQTRLERATNTAIERLGDVPAAGDWMFAVIAGAMVILVLLVGPFDYFFLKRLGAGHRSWLTALGWISAASVVAYAMPRLFRTAPTQVNRISIVDCILPPPTGGQRTSFAVGFTGLYSGESGAVRFLDADPASWWRGISVTERFGEPRGTGAVVPTLQSAAGGAAGSTRGNPLQELPISLWTFRVLTDTAATPATSDINHLAATITAHADDYAVLVAGLPDGVTVTDATLRIGDDWFTLSAPPSVAPRKPVARAVTDTASQSDLSGTLPPASTIPIGVFDRGTWTATFPRATANEQPPASWSLIDPGGESYGVWSPQIVADLNPGPVLATAGPDRRAGGIDAHVATGRWGAVYLSVTGMPAEPRLSWPSRCNHTRILRLVVPLETRPS